MKKGPNGLKGPKLVKIDPIREVILKKYASFWTLGNPYYYFHISEEGGPSMHFAYFKIPTLSIQSLPLKVVWKWFNLRLGSMILTSLFILSYHKAKSEVEPQSTIVTVAVTVTVTVTVNTVTVLEKISLLKIYVLTSPVILSHHKA